MDMRFAVLLLGFALASFAQATTPAGNAAPASVSGRVTDAVTGQGLEGATVSLIQLRFQNGTRQRLDANSQADGSFRIDGVSAGSYVLRCRRDGYVASQFNARVGLLEVAAGQAVTDANVQLNPDAAITGKVLDDAGNPAPGARVRAIEQTSRRGHTLAVVQAESQTDASGAFTLKQLPPGNYFVVAQPDPAAQKVNQDGSLLKTFYPRALDIDTATPTQVSPGQNAGDITLYLRRGIAHHVRGRLSDIPVSGRGMRVMWSPASAVDSPALTETVAVGKSGAFDIADVTPGTYTLRVFARFRHLIARQNVEVGGGDVNGVDVTPLMPVVLTGKATLPDNLAGARPRIRLIARPLENGAAMSASVTDVQADGSLQTTPLDPGPYLLQAVVTPPTLYVKAILLNQQDVTDKATDISDAAGNIEIVLATGSASISGTTTDGVAGTAVVLVPDPVAPDGSNVQFANTAANGSFQFQNLRPGDYKVFATALRDYGTWQNPEFLSHIDSQGTTVTVAENQQQQVQLPLVAPEIVQSAAAQIGLTMD